MAIQPNDMLVISLPAQHWEWLMNVLPGLNVPMQPRDQIVSMLAGQLQAHVARAQQADQMTGAAAPAANDAPPPAKPARKRRASNKS
jgi:hypothetical protein